MAEEKEIREEATAEETKETAEAETAPAEKKENAFSKFWKKTKQSVNDSILEGKIRASYEKAHKQFSLYEKDALISSTLYGTIEGTTLTSFGKTEIKPYSVLIATDEGKAYYVLSGADTTVKSMVEGVEYEREGTIIELDENVEEVNVIKAGKRYFIYKGTEKD